MGTPRCGSTLAERILLASGMALPLGEIGTFPRMLRHLAADLGASSAECGGMFDAGRDQIAYLERLLALPRAHAIKCVKKVAEQYLAGVTSLRSSGSFRRKKGTRRRPRPSARSSTRGSRTRTTTAA